MLQGWLAEALGNGSSRQQWRWWRQRQQQCTLARLHLHLESHWHVLLSLDCECLPGRRCPAQWARAAGGTASCGQHSACWSLCTTAGCPNGDQQRSKALLELPLPQRHSRQAAASGTPLRTTPCADFVAVRGMLHRHGEVQISSAGKDGGSRGLSLPGVKLLSRAHVPREGARAPFT